MEHQPVLFAPTSTWAPPHTLQEVQEGEPISIDLETYDPGLKQRGPGSRRKEGYVVGVALATARWEVYLPFRHPENNLAKGLVLPYVRDALKRAGLVIFANAAYDLGWLEELGLEPLSLIRSFYDIIVAEALLNEERPSYSLQSLATSYLGVGKDEELLQEAATAYGVGKKGGLAMLPARFVGAYAEADVRRTFDVYVKQQKAMQGYARILALENRVIPLVHRMYWQGIPISIQRAESLLVDMEVEEQKLRLQGRREYGADVQEWSGAQIAKIAERLKLPFPRTEAGNPSFTSDFLTASTHPFFKLVNDLRDVNKHRSTFVEDWFFKNALNGRIHPQWHQMASDEGGTKTGRMSCSNPNAQQVPRRGKWGAAIRSCFVAQEGEQWAKLDYSQQEPRILVHYGIKDHLRGVESLAQAYRLDKKADVYSVLSQAAGVERDAAKVLTLASIYGMGLEKLADKLRISLADATALRATFDAEVPFVRELATRVSKRAELRGLIRTLGGRGRHFNLWEPSFTREKVLPLPRAAAERAFGGALRRAYTFKALNSLIQGSAADMTKMAMANIWDDLKIIPYMPVHDELNYGVPNAELAHKIQTHMEQAYELEVPILAELKLGDSWK